MRVLLLTAMLTGFAASSAFAACWHDTTAQSKAPVVVAQNETPLTAAPTGQIDDTLTGSTVDETLVRKPAAEVPQAK